MTPTQEWTLPGGPAAGLIAEPLPEVHRCSMGEWAGTCALINTCVNDLKLG